MGNFFAELKRRHIYRVAAAYTVVAWALTQAVDILSQVFALPAWVAQPVLVLLAIGFPVALLVAWILEGKPQAAIASAMRSKTGTVDWLLFGALAVVIALIGYRQFTPGTAPAASAIQPGNISIAVLPFTNLSSDPEQEFFSDGMTEEITSALAKVPNLQVVGRTSAFAFKGQNQDLRTIGQALGATHLIEGSVRKAGDRVRISAQLIRADNGLHLWTENYDRELTDVFAIQEDIAQAIATALRVPLGLQQGETLVSNRTGDTELYQDYLRAKALVRARSFGNPQNEPIGLLEQVVGRDPGYAAAWALLAQAYAVAPNYDIAWLQGPSEDLRRVADAAFAKAEAAARNAIELDPRNADAHAALGNTRVTRGRLLEAEDLYKQALALDPVNPNALHWYSSLVAAVGRVKEAVAMRQQLRSLEPLVPIFNSSTDQILWVDGQNEAALAIANALPSDNILRARDLARIYASMGRYGEAADILLTTPAGTFAPGVVESAVRLLRMAPAPAPRQDMPYLALLSFVYLYVGAPERALELSERNVEAGYQVQITNAVLWHPSYAPARKTERFKALVRNAGLADYWRERGWADLCRPVGANDFECD